MSLMAGVFGVRVDPVIPEYLTLWNTFLKLTTETTKLPDQYVAYNPKTDPDKV